MKNRLFYGDNLEVLRKNIKDESVDLCYIDPPFNSKRNYNQIYNNIGNEDLAQAQAFVDTWRWDELARVGFDEIIDNANGRFNAKTVELIRGLSNVIQEGSLLAYLVSITLRVTEIQRVLKPSGSFYLHCDPTASHYLKLIVDSIFLPQGGDFQNEIIWRRTGSHNKLQRFGPIHDVIFFYTKSANGYYWHGLKRPYMQGHIAEYFVQDEKGYKTAYYGNVLTGSGTRNGESGKPWKGINPTAKGRHWAVPGALLEDLEEDLSELGQHEKLDRLFELGHITFTEGDTWPMYSRYLTKGDGQPLSDLWTFQPYTNGLLFESNKGIDEDVRWLSTKDAERLGYPTQKPMGLLERIIKSSCPPDGIVLDAYCGCGTTIDAAEKLKMGWVGIDITYHSIALVLKRIEDKYGEKAIHNITTSGIPRDMNSVRALASKADDRLRKEFEKWAVLTYTNNRSIINEKKGADGGIDGTAYFKTGKRENAKIIFQAKSGHVKRGDIATLRGDMEKFKADMAIFLTLEDPTPPMVKDAKAAGQFTIPEMAVNYDRISIVTIQEIVEIGLRLQIPMSLDVLKKARGQDLGEQLTLL
jgi:DNA modification methylase